MKATERGSMKAKTAIKKLSTKAKAKKLKGGTTKKTRKKVAASNRKKNADTRKTSPRKKRIVDDERSNATNATKTRRSIRNRNNSLNYGELSNESLDESGDEISLRSQRTETITRRRSSRTKEVKSKDREENWMVYDQGNFESDASWNENFRRLQEFQSKFGHSGVPIYWSEDPDFSEWVSRQRQLFREIRTGYRIASEQEEGRWKRLQVLRFPLDYENWLWKRKYNELCEALNGEKYTDYTILPSPLREWVDYQKSSAESYEYGKLDSERKKNLEKLGVIETDNSIDGSINYE